MPYLCVHCDVRFEPEGNEPPRCPKCLRVHDIQPVGEAVSPAPPHRGRVRLIAAVVLVAAGGAAAWFATRPTSATIDATASPQASAAVAALAAAGDEAARLGALFAPNDVIEAFAERAVQGRSGPIEQAQGVFDALRARASAQAFVPWSRIEPRDEPVRVAAEALEAVGRDGAKLRLYPLELVALAVAALRSIGVDAKAAEAFEFSGEKAPPDPSARLGYFVVAVPEGAGQAFFDPADGRARSAAAGDHDVLEDAEALGAAFAIEASTVLAGNGDPRRALALADAAVALAPRSAAVRVTRANVLLTSAGVEEAQRELEAAVQLRDDAPRRHALALYHAARGDREAAQRDLSLALERAPEYAAAQATLALLHLSRGERDEAHLALERARELDPDLPQLPIAFAQLHASAGELDQALAHARRATDRNPKSAEAHLAVAGILRAAGRYEDMREHARTALSLVHESQRARTEKLIRAVLGPTALDAPSLGAEASPAADEAPASAAVPDRLTLDGDLGVGADPEAGRLKLGDSPSTLRLREPGQDLDLAP